MNVWLVSFIKGKEERTPMFIYVEAPDAVTAIEEASRIVRDEHGWGTGVFFTEVYCVDREGDDLDIDIGVVDEDIFTESGDYEYIKW